MSKIRAAILMGGKSGEHEVSLVSATSVFKALDKTKYDITLIGIDKSGRWVLIEETELLSHANPRDFDLSKQKNTVCLVPYESESHLISLTGQKLSHRFDVILPILHGTFGEDGTVQGLFELANIAYVGSGVIGSSVGMDKDVSRRLLKAAGIPVVPTEVVRKADYDKNPQQVIKALGDKLGWPYFIKPANAGSSVGVHKVKSADQALPQFQDAFEFDHKILAEKSVAARELECSVLGMFDAKASIIGEIVPNHEFYTYEAKYLDDKGADLKIPAENLSSEQVAQLQQIAVQAFQVLELRGLARVDFFLDKKTKELFLNEVNTMPGFTSISMYPKLWAASGKAYGELLDELIRIAMEVHRIKNSLKTSYE